jgi:hypothetical protein
VFPQQLTVGTCCKKTHLKLKPHEDLRSLISRRSSYVEEQIDAVTGRRQAGGRWPKPFDQQQPPSVVFISYDYCFRLADLMAAVADYFR